MASSLLQSKGEQMSGTSRVGEALGRFEGVLAAFHQALEQNDQAAIARLLQQGKDHRDALGN